MAHALETIGTRRVPTRLYRGDRRVQQAIRGGILDVYGFGMAGPARLEWWGDDVSSLRGFDLTTQRSLQELSGVTVLPVSTEALREEMERGGRGKEGRWRRPSALPPHPP